MKKFIEKVIREGAVDTRKYRYAYCVEWGYASIRRIERRLLGTTAAIDGWETVKEWRL